MFYWGNIYNWPIVSPVTYQQARKNVAKQINGPSQDQTSGTSGKLSPMF